MRTIQSICSVIYIYISLYILRESLLFIFVWRHCLRKYCTKQSLFVWCRRFIRFILLFTFVKYEFWCYKADLDSLFGYNRKIIEKICIFMKLIISNIIIVFFFINDSLNVYFNYQDSLLFVYNIANVIHFICIYGTILFRWQNCKIYHVPNVSQKITP